MSGISYFVEIARIASTLKGMPYKCTPMIAFGFFPFKILSFIASSKATGHKFQVSFSLSIKTGIAPKYKIGLAEAEKVIL
jgi:hypothetical protein